MSDFYQLDPARQVALLEQLAPSVLPRWGIDSAELRLIKYRENAVFELNAGTRRYALRMHRMGYHTDPELESELDWMTALSDAGVRVPQVVPALDGSNFVKCQDNRLPQDLQVDLFEWLNGDILGSVEDGVTDQAQAIANFRTMGELAARVHNQASQWTPPAGFVRHAWDAEGLAGEQPFWGRFWELSAASPAQRQILNRARSRVFQDLKSLQQSPMTYSMIHADFAPENIMIDDHGLRLIDFDDAGFGWHLFELATSLYFVTGEGWYEDAKQALIAGYRSQRELTDAQLALLPLFLLARGLTYIGWVHTRQETETAQELTPAVLEMGLAHADAYLA